MERQGLRLGLATNIRLIILSESIDAVKLVMDNPEATTRDIMEVCLAQITATGHW